MVYKDLNKRREYQREWRQKRREEYFEGKLCTKCNSTKNLELDHIDPKKKTSHNIWSWSEKRRNKELLKCQILCHKCHLEKTKNEGSFSKNFPIGSRNSSTKLKEKDIFKIRKRIESGETLRSIAKDYKVKHQTISKIKCKQIWQWLI